MAAAQADLREQRVAEADGAEGASGATSAETAAGSVAEAAEDAGSALARELGALATATYSAARQPPAEPTFRAAA
jgi:hypothetical protein